MRRWWMVIMLTASCWGSSTTTVPPDRTPPKTTEAGPLAVVTRCPGATRKPGCHGRDECVCIAGPLSDVGCGIGQSQTFGCKVDVDCGAALVCLQFDEGCTAGTRCAPRCRPDGCGTGNICQADGHCGPQLCNAGWDCSAYGQCAPGAKGADPHGCIAFACATDASCPCAGFCINERCSATQGECAQARG